jgi:hypothetical protein
LTVVIVASHDLWLTPNLVASITALVSTIPLDGVVGIRCDLSQDPSSAVERFVQSLVPKMGRTVWMSSPKGEGRAGTFKRDYELVEKADAVVAFFAPEQEMEGGTGHVVKAALDREVPVEAYGLDDKGELTLIGSDTGNPFRPGTLSQPAVLRRMWEENQ